MLCRPPLKVLAWLVGLLCLSAAGADVAHACACDLISPTQGFARTQYVFIGRVLEVKGHTWTEDLIVENYGPGEPPRGEDPWKRLPEHDRDHRD